MKPLNIELQKIKDEAATENDLTPNFTKSNSTISNCISNIDSNDAESQRARILDYIQQFESATTIELRRDLDILMPAARVHELRHEFGYQIDTVWTYQETDCGKTHRIARYVYRGNGKTNDLFGGAA